MCKKEQGQYPAILAEQASWSIEDLLYGFREIFFCEIQYSTAQK